MRAKVDRNVSGSKPWHTENPVAAASVLGGVLYLIVAEGYRSALRPFGISPQEVGIDYSAAVWPAAQVFVVLSLLYWLFRISPVQALANFVRQPLGLHVVILIAIMVALTELSAMHYLHAVRSGEPYRPFPFGRMTVLPGLKADAVELVWKDQAAAHPSLPTGRLLLLGYGGGTAYIYVPKLAKTVRLPAGDVVVVTMYQQPRTLSSGGGPGEEAAGPP